MRAKNLIKLSIEVPEDLTDFFPLAPLTLLEKGRESMMPLSIMGKALSGVLSSPKVIRLPSFPRNEEQGDDSDSD